MLTTINSSAMTTYYHTQKTVAIAALLNRHKCASSYYKILPFSVPS